MVEKASLGIFIGRFQPLHKGHLNAIEYSLSQCKNLIIGVGSAQESKTDKNPLSSKERIGIIKAALKMEKVEMRRVSFLEIPDFYNNDIWFNYIIKKSPGVEIVFSRNKLVNRIFREHGIKTVQPKWHKRHIFKAGLVREIIRSGKKWEDRVPRGAVTGITQHKEKIRKSINTKGGHGVNVIIGGTFAYLHKGHVALISKAFDVGDFVYVGLTTDRYVKNFKPYKKMPKYSDRKRALVRLLKSFGKRYKIEPLDDKYGPACVGDFDAIVVSTETFPVALEINKIRRIGKLMPLKIVRIGYVLGDDSRPISTSRILRGEIDRNGKRI